MKISIISLLLSLLHFCVWGSDKSIKFRSISNLDEAIEVAAKENKLIFVDCYTEWCGPCKLMEKTVFTKLQVSNFYNQKFICVKADMESDQWKNLAKDYPVYGYPTFLFINSKRILQHMKTGACNVKQFSFLGQVALDNENNLLYHKQKFDSGDRTAKTLRNFFAIDVSNKLKNEATIKFIRDTKQKELYSSDAWYFLTNNRDFPDSIFKNYILIEYQNYFSSVGEKEVIKYIELIWSWGIMKQGKKEYRKLVKESTKHPVLLQVLARYNVSHANDIYQLLPTNSNAKKLVTEANEYMKYTYKDGHFLNEIAWEIYGKYAKHKNTSYIESALSWINASIEDEMNSFNLDTKANILFLLGYKKQAIETQTKAIEIAQSGDDMLGSSTDYLQVNLEKFKNSDNKNNR